MKNFVLITCVVLLTACGKNKKNDNLDNELNNKYYVNSLVSKCVEKGDSIAYGELIDFYGRNPSENYELLPISLIMADKFNNDNARVTIYYQMIMINNEGNRDDKLFFKLSKSKQEFIISYLLEGVKKQNSGCVSIMKKINNGLNTKNID